MTKRTRRYGGFYIGDKIKHKKYGLGRVVGYLNGCIYAWFDKFDRDSGYFGQAIAPNQLINLTRIEEEKKQKEYSDKLDKKINELFSPEDGKELFKVLTKDDFMKGFNSATFEDLTTGTIEEREAKLWKLTERVAKLEMETANILTHDPLPSPYTRDVYTTTNDY